MRDTLARLRASSRRELDDPDSALSALVDRQLRSRHRRACSTTRSAAPRSTAGCAPTADDLLRRHHHQIGLTVRENLEALETGTLVARIEERVGADLQFIRLNGAVVGGLVGLALATVHWLVG